MNIEEIEKMNKNKKKVLVINTISSKIDNGVYCVLYNYAKITSNMYDYDFVLAGYSEQKAIKQLEIIGNKILVFQGSRVKSPLLYLNWLNRIIRDGRYDIIHVHGNSATMFLEICIAKWCGVSVRVCHCHSTSCKFKVAHYTLKLFLNLILTKAVACSNEAGKWLYYHKHIVLNNGINSEIFIFNSNERIKYRSELSIDDSFVIGHVGYLSDEKNQHFLIELATVLKEKISNFKFLLIGDGLIRQELEQEIKRHSLGDYFLLIGRRTDVAQLYSAMDMYIFPSKFEGFGLALIEAQANGLCCVASDRVPNATQIGENVTYLSLDEKDKWIDIIYKIYLMHQKNDRNQESNKNIANIKIKGYDVSSNKKKLIDIYEGLI